MCPGLALRGMAVGSAWGDPRPSEGTAHLDLHLLRQERQGGAQDNLFRHRQKAKTPSCPALNEALRNGRMQSKTERWTRN